jgi:FtsZ-interacting cell division protein ZipA
MSELQIALIGFGALLVALVWGYNLWQERKQRRSAEAAFPVSQPDVLMAGREAAPEPRVVDNAAVLREPTFAEPSFGPQDAAPQPEAEAPTEEPRQTVAVPAEWADGRADCLLRVEFVDPVSVSALWTEYSAWSQKLDKPVQWLGLDERTGRWRNLLPQDPGAVAQVAVALQLVDRAGPVAEASLTSFLQDVHRFAQSFSGLVELPDTVPMLAQARELDAFCAAVDLQLALHVLPRQGSLTEMVGAKLKPVIEAGGLKLEGERFVAVDAAGAETFALTCQAATPFSAARLDAQALTGLTFSLDVPRVAAGSAAFDCMIGFARQCAETLGGQLVDAQHKALSDATIAALRARIGELQAKMAQVGIPAGGMRALRLFS